MARDWEQDFRLWGRPPGTTEAERSDNAVRVVQNAVRSYAAFSTRNLRVFAQGSYRNGTNVRKDSDVDVCVCCMDVCFADYLDGVTSSDTRLGSANYTYAQFKGDVEAALRAYLGAKSVTRGDKAIDLHENSYRVEADVVPTFEHRRYYRDGFGQVRYLSGTELHPDKGGRVINWPEQNYRNGTNKNQNTSKRYKMMVRILKRLRNEMENAGRPEAKPISSYLLECLVWNVPDLRFGNKTYCADVTSILGYLYSATEKDENCKEWREVNELKYLFQPSQPWTREQARKFVLGAWSYVGVLK
ncbi:MAG: nucleotidyltransferase [Deltaproteobacteria bacterium CG_4_9_14_3_um_filter_63_12]|nr:MAG: nucleotidyltransferase [Deltaproteobacteria bacterium CG_4_9_14_3_um_filter_63_12]